MMTVLSFLQEYGIDISYVHGSTIKNIEEYPSYYWALNFELTFEFINICKEECVPILGVDIITKKNNLCSLSFDTWCYQRRDNETFSDYLRNSIDGASDYICLFKNFTDILFSFCIFDSCSD